MISMRDVADSDSFSWRRFITSGQGVVTLMSSSVGHAWRMCCGVWMPVPHGRSSVREQFKIVLAR